MTLFHICGDNTDHTMKQQYMRVDKTRSDEIHYFHAYAVSYCIDFSSLSERVMLPWYKNLSMLCFSCCQHLRMMRLLKQHVHLDVPHNI